MMISLINTHFGEGYANAYFSDGELKKGYQYLSSNHALIIFSFPDNDPKTIKLNVVVVEKHQQNKGEGSKLLNEFYEKYAVQFDILIPLWNYKGSESLRFWIEKKGGELLQSFNEYWRDESLEKGYVCVVCGAPPCSCRMDLYVLKRK